MKPILASIILVSAISCEKKGGSSIDWFAARKSYNYKMVDRVANPGIENFLIESTEARDRLNTTEPDQDLINIGDTVRTSIAAARQALPSSDVDEFLSIDDAAALLIPNVLSLKLNSETSYPDNGRSVSDDYYDRFLEVVFAATVADGIEQSFSGSEDFPFIDALETSP
jgi:hypothetical protein